MNVIYSPKVRSCRKLFSNIISYHQHPSVQFSLFKTFPQRVNWRTNLPNASSHSEILLKVPKCIPCGFPRYMHNNNPPRGHPRKGVGMAAAFSWKSLLLATVVGGFLVVFVIYVKKEKQLAIERERTRSIGKAKIDAYFDLIDHNGKPCTSKDFLGHWCLIYFGFTHCPDICPDELEKLGKVVDKLNENTKRAKVQPLFITVDPERDNTKAVKAYVKEFHPEMIGLTGTLEKIGEACHSFRVYFSSGPKDQDDDYIVDHTVIIYLVNPDFEFVDYYGQTKTAEMMATTIESQMHKYNRNSKTGIRAVLNI